MGNNNFKRTIISMSILVIVIAVSYLFIRFLPYILLGVLIAYIAYKITRFFSNRRNDGFYDNNQNENQSFNSTDTEENEFDTDKAIDIEYKEVDKDKK